MTTGKETHNSTIEARTSTLGIRPSDFHMFVIRHCLIRVGAITMNQYAIAISTQAKRGADLRRELQFAVDGFSAASKPESPSSETISHYRRIGR
jgi:hypothetical protein